MTRLIAVGDASASDGFINQASHVRQTRRFNWGRLPSAGGGDAVWHGSERRISDGVCPVQRRTAWVKAAASWNPSSHATWEIESLASSR